MPLIIEALRNRRYRQIQLALQAGCNANDRDPTNMRTPLIELSYLDREVVAIRLCKLLLEKGAKIDLRDKSGRNALLNACLNRRKKLVEAFLKESDTFNLNDRDHQGNTALSLAATSGSAIMVRLLVNALKKYRLNVDVCNNRGETPLILASKTQNYHIRDILIYEGRASTEIRDGRRYMTAKDWERNREAKITENKMTCKDSSQPEKKRISMDSRYSSRGSESYKCYGSKFRDGILKLEDGYKHELNKLFNVYQQQLSPSYRPQAVPPPRLKDKDVSVASESDVDEHSVCFLDRESLKTCPITPFRHRKRFSVSTAVHLSLSANKLLGRRMSLSMDRNKDHNLSTNVKQDQGKKNRRGSLNVMQKLQTVQVPPRKRHASVQLDHNSLSRSKDEMLNLLGNLDALREVPEC